MNDVIVTYRTAHTGLRQQIHVSDLLLLLRARREPQRQWCKLLHTRSVDRPCKIHESYAPKSRAPFSPELFSPISIAAPVRVGMRDSTIGIMRSTLQDSEIQWADTIMLWWPEKLTILSEYHPMRSVLTMPIAPPGVERINVCLDLCMPWIQSNYHSHGCNAHV